MSVEAATPAGYQRCQLLSTANSTIVTYTTVKSSLRNKTNTKDTKWRRVGERQPRPHAKTIRPPSMIATELNATLPVHPWVSSEMIIYGNVIDSMAGTQPTTPPAVATTSSFVRVCIDSVPRLFDRHQHIQVRFFRQLPPFGSLHRRHDVTVVLFARAKSLIGRIGSIDGLI